MNYATTRLVGKLVGDIKHEFLDFAINKFHLQLQRLTTGSARSRTVFRIARHAE